MSKKEKSNLRLKWGTLKEWKLTTEKQKDLMMEYRMEGMSAGAAQQTDSRKQKKIICKLIDTITGDIINDWSGETMTKQEAKDYVMKF